MCETLVVDEPSLPVQTDDERFAASVKRLREEKGWSQGELAKRMAEVGFDGFHQTTISRIEKNDRPVRIGEARGLAKALGTLVGIMIAPPAGWRVVDQFVKEVVELNEFENRVGSAVFGYLHQRVVVEKALGELDELGEPDWLDEALRDVIQRHRASASRLLNRSYSDAIDDALDPSGSLRYEAEHGAE